MNKLVESYINHLNEGEGALSLLNKVFVLFGWGKPFDRKFKVVSIAYNSCLKNCDQMHKGSKEVTTTVSADVNPSKPKDNATFWDLLFGTDKTERTTEDKKQKTIETYKEDPKHGSCLVKCQYAWLKNVCEVLKKERKTICNENINTDLCNKWVERYLPELEAKRDALAEIIKQETSQQNVQVTVGKLGKVL